MHIRLIVEGGRVVQLGSRAARLGSCEHRRGPWARWAWDGSEDGGEATLTAEVDRYGLYPLFWAALPDGGIALADSFGELLQAGAARELDDDAIAAFLRLGFFVGEDTPFRAIRAFPPGGRLRWSAAGLSLDGAPLPRTTDWAIGRDAAIDGFVERFREAVAGSLPDDPERVALPLSGGRDSRHIALELHRLGYRPGLVISQRHYPSRSDEDADIAARLCEALGWSLQIVPQGADPVGAEIDKNRRFECLTDEHAWFAPAAGRIAGAGMRYVFDGIAGDVLSKGLFVRPSWIELGRTGQVEAWLRGMPAWGYGADENGLEALLRPDCRRRWRWQRALARVQTEFARHAGDENPINAFMFWNRTRREIAPFLVRYLPGVEVVTPYLAPAVFDFLWRLPSRLLEDHRLHDEAIARAAPAFAGIPFESGALPADPAGHAASLMRGMARRWAYWRPGAVLDRGWLRPRLAGAAFSQRLGRGAGWYAFWAVWLGCLERLAEA